MEPENVANALQLEAARRRASRYGRFFGYFAASDQNSSYQDSATTIS